MRPLSPLCTLKFCHKKTPVVLLLNTGSFVFPYVRLAGSVMIFQIMDVKNDMT